MLVELRRGLAGHSERAFVGEFDSVAEAVETAVRRGVSLHGVDLHNKNLTGRNLCNAQLHHANLGGAWCINTDFTGANLLRADMCGANLAGARLTGAWMHRTDLRHAYLAETDMSGVYGDISRNQPILSRIALQFDENLWPVTAMMDERTVGFWDDLTAAIRQQCGTQADIAMRRMWQAWTQDSSWNVEKELRKCGWPKPNGD